MSDPGVTIVLDGHRREFAPGETLAGEFRINSLSTVDPKAVELSVLWCSEGKGDEDLAVHHFQRIEPDEAGGIDYRQPYRFEVVLPPSPLSYEGLIVKLRWCVRVRLFPARGREVTAEEPIVLGNVPPARLLTEENPVS